jgi:RNA polymerase sigma-70 factor (ECF subfamily)
MGCQKAQFALYKQYYKAMFNTAYRIVNNRFEAEDIMQESFLSAFTKLDSFSGNVTFGAWLKRIVINNSITALKKSKRFEEISLNENIEVTSLDDDANESLKGLQTKEVLQTLNLLKPNYKLALTLHFIEGYDYEEVAQIMEISYENSRTTISRAKNKLKQLLLVRYEG